MDESYAFRGENFSVKITTRNIRSRLQQFEVVERPKIVMALPMALDGKALFFVRQQRVAVNQITIELPAGRVDEEENSEHAIRRELLEEIGFSSTVVEYVGNISTAPHFCDEKIQLFIAKGSIVKEPKPTSKESNLDVIRVECSTLLSKMKAGFLTDAKSLAALSLAMANNYFDM